MHPDEETTEEVEEVAEVIELPTPQFPDGDAERRASMANVNWDRYPLRPDAKG